MEKIDKDAQKIIDKIKTLYGKSADVNGRIIKIKGIKVGCIFLESSSQTANISNFIIKGVEFASINQNIFQNVFNSLKNSVFNCQLFTIKDFSQFPYYLSSGFTIIVVDNAKEAIVMETRAQLDRGVVESTTEPILRGAKDSFTESHSKNLGLIRKRIKDPNLWFKELKLGRRTQTRVSIAYINGIAKKENITKITNHLSSIDIDGILESGNLRDYLTEKNSIFPQIQSSERPDIACQALLNGKIVILVENSPFTLILPSVFIDFFHTSEDEYQKPLSVSLTRILRLLALVITLFTPAIYIAITTFDQNTIPNKLLISLAVQREGIPFPTSFEILLLMTVFEVLKESDIRSPSSMGAAMSIVGALVLGQAVADAGIVSPITVIIAAITSICSLIFTDVDFMNGIRTWRFIFIIAASLLGLIGILSVAIILLTRLAALENLNTSFLAPFAPLDTTDQKDALIKFPLPKLFKRPKYISKLNPTKQGGQNEK
jgi:spore germination protein KA